MNKNFNYNTSNKNYKKRINNFPIINSLHEVECFLNNLDKVFSSIKFINILNKHK